jgi:hypothetical protein
MEDVYMERKTVFRSQKDSGLTDLSKYPYLYVLFFKFHEWAFKFTNSQLANYLWSDEDGTKKYIFSKLAFYIDTSQMYL